MDLALIERLTLDVRKSWREAAEHQVAGHLDRMRAHIETAIELLQWIENEGYKPSSAEANDVWDKLKSFGLTDDECDKLLEKLKGFGSAGGRPHKKNKRGSTKQDHEEGEWTQRQSRGREKGDRNRPPPRRRPEGHKGPWPLRPKKTPDPAKQSPRKDDTNDDTDEGEKMDGQKQLRQALKLSRIAEQKRGPWPVDLLQEAAEAGNLEAIYALATWYLHGRGVPKNAKTAASLLKKAADHHYAVAEYDLAVSYELGVGVKKSPKAAFQHYLRAANDGDLDSQSEVARCYYFGIGTAKNPSKAFEWYERAAKSGNAEAQYVVGRAYELGDGVEKNDRNALRWFKKAAAAGYETAEEAVSALEGKS